MNAYLYPYSCRILASLHGDTPVEIYRTRKTAIPQDVLEWLNELTGWEVYAEYATPKSWLVGSRPNLVNPAWNRKQSLKLSRKEMGP